VPVTPIDMADAAELAELLQLIAGWLASDPATLGASLLKFIGHPAYSTQELRNDLHRFAFLLGCTDGEELFGPPEGPLPPSGTRSRASARLSGHRQPTRLADMLRACTPPRPHDRKPGRGQNSLELSQQRATRWSQNHFELIKVEPQQVAPMEPERSLRIR
jgi:hypothetical protein